MTTERQIAANRRNAHRSTGPKTSAGKRRASGNAYRHGLSVGFDDWCDSDAAKLLLRHLVGDSTDEYVRHAARAAVRAHLELLRVRQIKATIINLVIEFGDLNAPPPFRFRSLAAELRYLKRQPFDQPVKWPKPAAVASLPSDEMECTAEAVRRLIPELRKLNRYELRAWVAKDDALRAISLRMSSKAENRSAGM
ncbi:hypothetical protein ACRQ5Q_27620 [Bradyrhizobium sp. PMVTL-01]|uniref:hypothetical protein n=1 Tax=Bradyrhizobium sp. PMVTL-01 TaxID=3434999 RepID=UPI003F70295C